MPDFATDIFNVWLVGTYYMNPILDPGNHVAVAVVGAGGIAVL